MSTNSKYNPKNPYLWPILGALVGIACAAGFAYELIFRFDELPMRIKIFEVLFLIIVIIANAYLYGHRRSVTYKIKDGNLYVSNVFTKWLHDGITIPISSIRFIEFLAKPNHSSRVRIMYNKFDDLYLFSKDADKIISDLLRINSDIEIRREDNNNE